MEERIQELEIQLKYLQEVQAGSAQGNAELSEDGPVPNTVALERERVVYLQQDPLRQALRHCQTMEAVVNSAEAHNIRVQGVERTLQLIRSRCYWPKMSGDVEKWCRECERCILAKAVLPKMHVLNALCENETAVRRSGLYVAAVCQA
ncbi:hypothetical protein AAFF_G00102840 [Aldrovandia affinis]|uniref:Integrase zinc-binding domain-containing protein n=1 Tax=Aldrovandia affinis TaxID=143900 RepID=A0AAD7RUF9_9TELE|nr:hypothetical protein AAFF_G00102840 [Aldrovandia affinis]